MARDSTKQLAALLLWAVVASPTWGSVLFGWHSLKSCDSQGVVGYDLKELADLVWAEGGSRSADGSSNPLRNHPAPSEAKKLLAAVMGYQRGSMNSEDSGSTTRVPGSVAFTFERVQKHGGGELPRQFVLHILQRWTNPLPDTILRPPDRLYGLH